MLLHLTPPFRHCCVRKSNLRMGKWHGLKQYSWWSVMSVKADCVQLPPLSSDCAEQDVYTHAHPPILTKIEQLLCSAHQVFTNSQAVLLWNHKQPEKGFYVRSVGSQYSDALCNTHLAQHIPHSHRHNLSMQETCSLWLLRKLIKNYKVCSTGSKFLFL